MEAKWIAIEMTVLVHISGARNFIGRVQFVEPSQLG